MLRAHPESSVSCQSSASSSPWSQPLLLAAVTLATLCLALFATGHTDVCYIEANGHATVIRGCEKLNNLDAVIREIKPITGLSCQHCRNGGKPEARTSCQHCRNGGKPEARTRVL
ncbi:MAG: putative triple gene block protein 3 [Beijing sediment alphaflexivirus]|nr:MAG: putative triple gene block protein 3 [Beijing sediment alphaflexivirus]